VAIQELGCFLDNDGNGNDKKENGIKYPVGIADTPFQPKGE
jgi:hypothetical protein